jgi:hypothetical protein
MRLTVRPFAVASDEAVRFSTGWRVVRGDRGEALGDSIRDWDYMTVLSLQAEIEIDVTEVRRSAHVGKKCGLTVVVSAGSSTTRMRGPIWSGQVWSVSRERLRLGADIAGGELGGRLDLLTQLVVSEPDPVDDLGASMPGTILWASRHSVMLEGDGPQFPTEPGDLSRPPYGLAKAAWWLDIVTDDLDVAAAAAVRLIVNQAHPVMRRVLDGDTSSETVLALEASRWDVARQLIEFALDSPEFSERFGTFHEDSFGRLLSNIVLTHFPGETPETLRAMRTVRRARFEAALQNAARIFG